LIFEKFAVKNPTNCPNMWQEFWAVPDNCPTMAPMWCGSLFLKERTGG
jgi:hypothetical protein